MAQHRVTFIPDGGGQPVTGTLIELPPLSIWGPTDPRPGWGLPGPQPHPEHPIVYPPEIWGPTDPRPGWGLPPVPPWPPGQMPPAKADWRFQDDGWYFVNGPYARPFSLGSNSNLDPVKSGWKFLDGWYFVSGPYDKPIPIFGVEPPVDPEPPEQPPDVAKGDWVYHDNGWYWTFGPLDKPRPPTDGGGGNGGGSTGGTNQPPE